MGDVVLTSPLLRCIKLKHPQCQIHFLVKEKFKEAIETNIYVSCLHVIKDNLSEIIEKLKIENFDCVIDLQKNRKTYFFRKKLNCPSFTFPKLNFKKLLFTKFKINRLPNVHVVDRYFESIKSLNVQNDKKGLEYFINDKNVRFEIKSNFPEKYIAIVLGATWFTKRVPEKKWVEIISKLKLPVVLLGGHTEALAALEIKKTNAQAIDMCGKTNLQESAFIIKNSQSVITGDTGLMHIAAAFQKNMISIWGNTVPDFGMYPYMPASQNMNHMMQVENLKCRPCSKLGYQKCPKKHFKCMNDQDAEKIARLAE